MTLPKRSTCAAFLVFPAISLSIDTHFGFGYTPRMTAGGSSRSSESSAAQTTQGDRETESIECPASFPSTHWGSLNGGTGGGQHGAAGRPQLSHPALLEAGQWLPPPVRLPGEGRQRPRPGLLRLLPAARPVRRSGPGRGRFRNLLLKSLQHFRASPRRAGLARKRHPTRGFGCLDETGFQQENQSALRNTTTLDELFHRSWLQEVVERVLKRLEQESGATGNQSHFGVFRQRITAPMLEGTERPSLNKLTPKHGLTEKEATNQLITARRAYHRLVREEIRLS